MKKDFLIPVFVLAGLWLQFTVPLLRLNQSVATESPVLISQYQGGTDSTYLLNSGDGLTSPVFYVYPHYLTNQMFVGGANNCAIFIFALNTGYSISSVADGVETWTAGPSVSGSDYTLYSYYVLGDSSAVNKITVTTSGTPTTPSGNPDTYFSPWLTELQNCGSVGGTGTLETAATGSALSLTLSSAPSSGDAALGYFIDTNGASATPLPYDSTITVGSGFTLLSKSLSFGKVAEINTSTTSTSVPITYSGSNTILGIGIVIKKGASGTSPVSTKYVDHYQVEQVQGTSQEIYFPCSGDLIVGMSSGEYYVSSASGSTGTWETPESAIEEIDEGGAYSQVFYGYDASCASSTTVTPSFSGTQGSPGNVIEFASVTNALATSSTFDKAEGADGNQTTAANLSTVALTPAAENELIFNTTSWDGQAGTGIAEDANGHTPTPIFSGNSLANDNDSCSDGTVNNTLDEDNGWGMFTNASNTTAVTFIYIHTEETCGYDGGVGYWCSVSAAFK